jgi:hypothetical protein
VAADMRLWWEACHAVASVRAVNDEMGEDGFMQGLANSYAFWQGEKAQMGDAGEEGLGLADAIGLLRGELLKASEAGAGAPLHFPVESMTVELRVAATRSVDGKAGFRVPVIGVSGAAGWGREAVQTVTVVFGSPVDREGHPVKVSRASDEPKG